MMDAFETHLNWFDSAIQKQKWLVKSKPPIFILLPFVLQKRFLGRVKKGHKFIMGVLDIWKLWKIWGQKGEGKYI